MTQAPERSSLDSLGPPGFAPPRPGGVGTAIDAGLWPDVVSVPAGGIRSGIAGQLFTRAISRLGLTVVLPDGSARGSGAAGDPVMTLHRPEAFFRRLGKNGLIGFGESYMAGDWSADDLTGVLTVFAAKMASLVPVPLQALRHAVLTRLPHAESGTPTNARRNIARHYDLSNDMFMLFLDETLSYSAAIFDTDAGGAPIARPSLLARAQHRKIDRLLDGAQVGHRTRVLEIGTGWGELAIRAARRGAVVRSLTLSSEQRDLARERISAAGVADRVEVDLLDYRAATGEYDAVLSVEMIEAVGHDFRAEYFATLDRLLVPGGRVGLQAITMPHERMRASRDTYTWIQKYIFPGGAIPSKEAIERNVAAETTMRVDDVHCFGAHYAETLRLWRERFTECATERAALGFDDTFARMWTLYLAYSEAGFRAEYLDVVQYILVKDRRIPVSAGKAPS